MESIQALVAKHKAKAIEKEEEDKAPAQLDDEESNIMTTMSFEELGVCPEIIEAIKGMGYKHPTKI